MRYMWCQHPKLMILAPTDRTAELRAFPHYRAVGLFTKPTIRAIYKAQADAPSHCLNHIDGSTSSNGLHHG